MIHLHYHTPYRWRERGGRGGRGEGGGGRGEGGGGRGEGEGRERGGRGEGEGRERGGREEGEGEEGEEREVQVLPNSPSLPLPHYFKTKFCYYKRCHNNATLSTTVHHLHVTQ